MKAWFHGGIPKDDPKIIIHQTKSSLILLQCQAHRHCYTDNGLNGKYGDFIPIVTTPVELQ